MRSSDIVIVGKITLVYLLINSFFLFAAHFLAWPILQKWYVSLLVPVCGLVVAGSLFRRFTFQSNYVPQNAFLLLAVTIACCFLSSTLSFLFLHHYLDPNYKYAAADRQVERSYKRVKEIEREKNVTMDFDEEEERKDALNQYQIGRIVINYAISIPFAFLLSWLTLSLIKPPESSV